MRILNFFLFLAVLFSCYEEDDIPLDANFGLTFQNDDASVPTGVNLSYGNKFAQSFQWTFEGGVPSSSTERDPGLIQYSLPGSYVVTLTVTDLGGNPYTSSQTIEVFDEITIDYTLSILESNFSPMEVSIDNQTKGSGLSYNWTFEDGSPSTSNLKNPGNVVFSTPGEHTINLTVSSDFESFNESKTIMVAPAQEVDFTYTVNRFDDDFEAPVTIFTQNNSLSTTAYLWQVVGANPSSSTAENPSFTFNNPGTYTIKLTGDNGKTQKVAEQEITILADTNLRVLEEVRFGIYSAHQSGIEGAFYHIRERRSLSDATANELPGEEIELSFFGLNQNFTENRFVSPNAVTSSGFTPIANAQKTIFINRQESCGCGANISVSGFDNMTTDNLLSALSITETAGGSQAFDNSILPRIVLFQTADGRKGAIKIKAFVNSGAASYLLTDIKVQKLP